MNQYHNFNLIGAEILIVDDTPANIDVLRSILQDEGYEILVAANGRIALDVAASAGPQLILLDVMMPEMDGFETCQKLKENEKTEHIPVIFVTAKTEVEDIVNGFRLGAVDYISKPIVQEEVKARVRTHLIIQALSNRNSSV